MAIVQVTEVDLTSETEESLLEYVGKSKIAMFVIIIFCDHFAPFSDTY